MKNIKLISTILLSILIFTGCSSADNSKISSKTIEESTSVETIDSSTSESESKQNESSNSENKKIEYQTYSENAAINNFLNKLKDDSIQVFYDGKLGYIDFDTSDEMTKMLSGENSKAIGFVFNLEDAEPNKTNATVKFIPDDDKYNELKDRYTNPEQEKYDTKLNTPKFSVFNDKEKLIFSYNTNTNIKKGEQISKILEELK